MKILDWFCLGARILGLIVEQLELCVRLNDFFNVDVVGRLTDLNQLIRTNPTNQPLIGRLDGPIQRLEEAIGLFEFVSDRFAAIIATVQQGQDPAELVFELTWSGQLIADW